MEIVSIALAVLVSLGITLVLAPYFMRKLREEGLVSMDYYKRKKVMLPSKGGLLIIFAAIISLMVTSVIMRVVNVLSDTTLPREFTEYDQAVLFVMMFFAFYGTLDDYMNVGRPLKILIPLLFAYPFVIVYISPPDITLPILGTIDMSKHIVLGGVNIINLSQIYRYIVIPFFIMIVANLVNMHSGFNGLQSGLSTILLGSLLIKAYTLDDTTNIYTSGALFGALLGFWWYNKYPSRMFEGNVGAMAVGGALGATIVAKGYIISATIMLIPHIVNFLMYVYWRTKRVMLIRQEREVGIYHHQIKFGKLRPDGTLEVPNRLTLKWLLPFHYRMTEKQSVLAMYGVTILFCVLGILWPYY